MRQAGVLAAAGIVALETMVGRLGEDHLRAQRLARGLSSIPGLVLDPGTPYSNMIFCQLSKDVPLDAQQVASALKALGVLVGEVGTRRFRLVTHYWIDDRAVEQALSAFREVLIHIDRNPEPALNRQRS